MAKFEQIVAFLPITMTSLVPPDTRPLIQRCLDYIEHADVPWIGPMLVQPASLNLFIGQSPEPNPERLPPMDAL